MDAAVSQQQEQQQQKHIELDNMEEVIRHSMVKSDEKQQQQQQQQQYHTGTKSTSSTIHTKTTTNLRAPPATAAAAAAAAPPTVTTTTTPSRTSSNNNPAATMTTTTTVNNNNNNNNRTEHMMIESHKTLRQFIETYKKKLEEELEQHLATTTTNTTTQQQQQQQQGQNDSNDSNTTNDWNNNVFSVEAMKFLSILDSCLTLPFVNDTISTTSTTTTTTLLVLVKDKEQQQYQQEQHDTNSDDRNIICHSGNCLIRPVIISLWDQLVNITSPCTKAITTTSVVSITNKAHDDDEDDEEERDEKGEDIIQSKPKEEKEEEEDDYDKKKKKKKKEEEENESYNYEDNHSLDDHNLLDDDDYEENDAIEDKDEKDIEEEEEERIEDISPPSNDPPPLLPASTASIRVAPGIVVEETLKSHHGGSNHSSIGTDDTTTTDTNNTNTRDGGGSGSGSGGGERRRRRNVYPIIEELYQAISDGEYIRFFDILLVKATEAEIAREGFQLLSKHLVQDHGRQQQQQQASSTTQATATATSSTILVLKGNKWPMVLKRNMERFSKESNVLLHGLICLITISRLHDKYMHTMVHTNKHNNNNNGGGGGGGDIVEVIITILNHHTIHDPQIVELAVSFIFILSANETHGLTINNTHVITIIRILVELLTSPTTNNGSGSGGGGGDVVLLRMGPTRVFAVLALWNLASQKRDNASTGRSLLFKLLFDVENDLVGQELIPALVAVIYVGVSDSSSGGGGGRGGGGGNLDIGGDVDDDDHHPLDEALTASSIQAAAGLLQLVLFPSRTRARSRTSSLCNSTIFNASISSFKTTTAGDEDLALATSPQALNELMRALEAGLEPRKPPSMNVIACLQAITSLMGNLALPRPNTTHFPGSGWSTPAIRAISQMIFSYFQYYHDDHHIFQEDETNPKDLLEGLALSSVHALCNWLAKQQLGARAHGNITRSTKDGQLVVTVLLQSLARYPNNLELQELGCLALGYACHPGPTAGESIVYNCADFAVQQGAMERIEDALDDHGALFDPEEIRNIPTAVRVRRGALSAMAALAECAAIVPNVVEWISKIEVLSAMEQEQDIQKLLQFILSKWRDSGDSTHNSIGSFMENSFTSSMTSFHANGEVGRSRHPQEAFANLMSSAASEEKVTSILQELEHWMSDEEVADTDKLALFFPKDGGMETLLETMGRFDVSSAVQEAGCAILSELYCRAPYHISSSSSSSWTSSQATSVINTLISAMQRHRGHPGVQNFVCLALSNFLGPLCDETSSQNENVSQDLEIVRGLINPCLKDVLTTMAINHFSPQVQKSAIELFCTLSFLCHADTMKLWMLRFVQQIYQAMKTFPLDVELNVSACNALLACQHDSEALGFFDNSDRINALLAVVLDDNGNEQVVTATAAVLAATLKKIVNATDDLVKGRESIPQDPKSIPKLISCMKANIANSKIQLYLCSILESLEVMNDDDGTPFLIYEADGLPVLCETLTIHKNDVLSTEYACRILSLVLGVVDGKAISDYRQRIKNSLIEVMEIHRENTHLQSAGMRCLWTYCRQDGEFLNLLLNETPQCFDLIVESMNTHLICSDIQRNGCRLLRLISNSNNLSSSNSSLPHMLGEKGAIAAVVNGMSAHLESLSVVKEALRVLKVLAMTLSNKPLISLVEGDTGVTNALWIHIRDPQLVSLGFAALNNIMVGEHNVDPMSDNAMVAIILSLVRYPTNESVQKQACFLLKSASYLESNLELMRHYRGQLTELLYFAAETFPDSCQNRAMGVIKKMEEYAYKTTMQRFESL